MGLSPSGRNGGRGFLHGKTMFRRENGTVPFGRKGTGTFFGLPVSGVRATDKRPKNEPVPGGPVNGYPGIPASPHNGRGGAFAGKRKRHGADGPGGRAPAPPAAGLAVRSRME